MAKVFISLNRTYFIEISGNKAILWQIHLLSICKIKRADSPEVISEVELRQSELLVIIYLESMQLRETQLRVSDGMLGVFTEERDMLARLRVVVVAHGEAVGLWS